MGKLKSFGWHLCALALAVVALSAPSQAAPPTRPTESDYAAAAARFRTQAERGNAEAQYNLGLLYFKGLGVPRDVNEAARLYRLSSDQGFTKAQMGLAMLYDAGLGVPRDYTEGSRLLGLAAAKGDARAQYLLSLRYGMGQGVARNDAEALRLLKLSADQGDNAALDQLANKYERGIGVPADHAQALRLYQRAAAQGDLQAKQHLSLMSTMDAGKIVGGTVEVPLRERGGVQFVPVMLEQTVMTYFIVDSGASDVVLPEPVVRAMKDAGKLSDSDFTGTQKARLADGSIVTGKVFTIRSMRVGNKVLENVKASYTPGSMGVPLLGQSFLRRFSSWAIDNGRQVLLLKELPGG
jgi:predicted aspartyl protease